MYVDEGSSSEILYEHCFKRLRPEAKNQMVPATTPLIGFSGEVIWLMGQISMPVKIGDAKHSTSTWMNFMVVRSPSPYNGIIGRHVPGLQGKHQGNKEAEAAFKQMKQPIAELPMLTAPMEKEELIVYLEGGARSFKGQILADFIVERPEEDSPDTPMEGDEELLDTWTLFTDGSSCVDGSEAGLILTSPERIEITYALRFRFDATNNEAEYEALIAGLKIAEQIGVKNLQASMDSCLVDNQINGSYIAKELVMILYLEKVKALSDSFKKFSFK
ncbi:reverse transcriptase domain-containing protein [Tanacetum coccineum]